MNGRDPRARLSIRKLQDKRWCEVMEEGVHGATRGPHKEDSAMSH